MNKRGHEGGMGSYMRAYIHDTCVCVRVCNVKKKPSSSAFQADAAPDGGGGGHSSSAGFQSASMTRPSSSGSPLRAPFWPRDHPCCPRCCCDLRRCCCCRCCCCRQPACLMSYAASPSPSSCSKASLFTSRSSSGESSVIAQSAMKMVLMMRKRSPDIIRYTKTPMPTSEPSGVLEKLLSW